VPLLLLLPLPLLLLLLLLLLPHRDLVAESGMASQRQAL
jgi:hypothetical protein